MIKNGRFKVEVKTYVDKPPRVVLWERGREGWLYQQALAIPEGIDGAWLEREVMRRLGYTQAEGETRKGEK